MLDGLPIRYHHKYRADHTHSINCIVLLCYCVGELSEITAPVWAIHFEYYQPLAKSVDKNNIFEE